MCARDGGLDFKAMNTFSGLECFVQNLVHFRVLIGRQVQSRCLGNERFLGPLKSSDLEGHDLGQPRPSVADTVVPERKLSRASTLEFWDQDHGCPDAVDWKKTKAREIFCRRCGVEPHRS